jgi:hypothetical protein
MLGRFGGSSEQSRLALVLEPVALAVDVNQGKRKTVITRLGAVFLRLAGRGSGGSWVAPSLLFCLRGGADVVEYLTTFEAAELLGAKYKTLKKMKARGVFREGVHFFRRPGLGPRWKRDALIEWLEGNRARIEAFPLAGPGGGNL